MNAGTRKVMLAGAIGNVLEWFDFAIYGYFAAEIGRTFFPQADPVAQVLSAFGIFAIGVVVRPLGGALLGSIGDRFGRRSALICSVATMAVPTFLIGLLPGYDVLGGVAPIALALLRMIQGLSAGGEYTTSVVFMVEHAPPGRRGLVGALACSSSQIGVLAGSATGAVLAATMAPEALTEWGWRVPFIAGLLLGAAGILLRRGLSEEMAGKGSRSPIAETLRDHWRLVLRLAGVAVFHALTVYLTLFYVASWLQLVDGIAPARALAINTVSLIALVALLPAMGWLSDRVGRRPLMLAAAACGFIAAWPLFWLLHHASPDLMLLGQLGFVLIISAFSGTGDDYSPAFMVMAAAPISIIALLTWIATAWCCVVVISGKFVQLVGHDVFKTQG